MKQSKLFPFVVCVMLVMCHALPSCAAEEAYRASEYFQRGYSAYASAVRIDGNRYHVAVDLQLAAEIPPHAGIASYTLYVDGEMRAVMPPGQNANGVLLPGHFVGEATLAQAPKTLTVVPTLIDGGDAAEEAIDLMPRKAAGSRVGEIAVVSNPNPEDRLNLRVAPSSQASSLRHYYNGTQALILNECADNWVSVCIGTQGGMARGYMKADFLAFGVDADGVKAMIPSETAVVSTWTLYSLPDEASDALGTFEAGQTFQVLGESTAWQHIVVGGITGFVRAGAVTTHEANDAQQAAIAPGETGAAGEESTMPPYLEAGDGTRMVIYNPPDGASH